MAKKGFFTCTAQLISRLEMWNCTGKYFKYMLIYLIGITISTKYLEGDIMKKRIFCLIITLSLVFSLAATVFAASAEDFRDVPDGAWYYDYLETACIYRLISGVTASEFAPQDSMTRAQFVTILARLDNADVSRYKHEGGDFVDVASDSYYFPYITWAAKKELVTGITPSTFAPNDNITREQAAVILSRYMSSSEISLPEKGTAPGFNDSHKISPYAVKAVEAFCKSGILIGDENNNFNPQKNISRAEAVALFVRLARASGIIDTGAQAISGFSVELFRNSIDKDGGNTLISPTSVLCALAIAANGADGETLAQMEDVFGLDTGWLNEYFKAYITNLPDTDKCKISIANSLWLNKDFGIKFIPKFQQTAADYYGASVFERTFNKTTENDINNWVSKNTDGMIEKALDEIDSEALTYIINTLLFDAEWNYIYKENQVRTDIFTTEDGTERSTEFMYDSVYGYISDENATGFMRYYADKKYAFAALLPNEGISVEEYVNTLTGNKLLSIIKNEDSYSKVITALPKFKSEFSAEMGDILSGMGMPDAFDRDRANFSRLAFGELYISRVIHKTSITVDERGTKAGAATIVEGGPGSAPGITKHVILDRPFVYMIIDCETSLPLFIGTMMDTK